MQRSDLFKDELKAIKITLRVFYILIFQLKFQFHDLKTPDLYSGSNFFDFLIFDFLLLLLFLTLVLLYFLVFDVGVDTPKCISFTK